MSEELYKRYRPKKLAAVVGQESAVKTLAAFGKDGMPHTLLFTGPSGCGKTTLARIAARQAGCQESEIAELNCADNRGIELARDLRRQSNAMPLAGDRKAWILDEIHQTTLQAQSALLKTLEDGPAHVYFFLCTSEPQKLLSAIVTRSTEIKVKSLSPSDVKAVLERVVKLDKIKVCDDALDAILNEADGSARKALVLLNQVKGIDGDEEQTEAVVKSSSKAKAFDLCRLLSNPRCSWVDVAAVLRVLEEDAETMRHMVLGYFTKVLLGQSNVAGRAALVIDRFQANFFDSKRAGLALACYEVIHAGKK